MRLEEVSLPVGQQLTVGGDLCSQAVGEFGECDIARRLVPSECRESAVELGQPRLDDGGRPGLKAGQGRKDRVGARLRTGRCSLVQGGDLVPLRRRACRIGPDVGRANQAGNRMQCADGVVCRVPRRLGLGEGRAVTVRLLPQLPLPAEQVIVFAAVSALCLDGLLAQRALLREAPLQVLDTFAASRHQLVVGGASAGGFTPGDARPGAPQVGLGGVVGRAGDDAAP